MRISILRVATFSILTFGTSTYLAADEVDDAMAEFFDMESNPVVRIINDFPVERAGAEARLREAFATGDPEVVRLASHKLGQELGAKYTTHYISRTSDDAILQYLEMQLLSVNDLAARDGVQCFGWVYGVAGIAPVFTDAITKIQIDAFSAIVVEIADTPRTLSKDEFAMLSTNVVQTMQAHFDTDHLYFDGMGDPTSVTEPEEQRLTCLTFWGYLAAITLLPKNDSAAYFRTMMTSQ